AERLPPRQSAQGGSVGRVRPAPDLLSTPLLTCASPNQHSRSRSVRHAATATACASPDRAAMVLSQQPPPRPGIARYDRGPPVPVPSSVAALEGRSAPPKRGDYCLDGWYLDPARCHLSTEFSGFHKRPEKTLAFGQLAVGLRLRRLLAANDAFAVAIAA